MLIYYLVSQQYCAFQSEIFFVFFSLHSFRLAKLRPGIKPSLKVYELKYIFCTGTGYGNGIRERDTLRNRYTGPQEHRPTGPQVKRQKIGLQGSHQHPTLTFFFGFLFRQLCVQPPITQIVYTTNVLYLHMSYKISIHNRIFIGFALGWSYYGKTEEYDYSEFTLFLGLLSIVIVRS